MAASIRESSLCADFMKFQDLLKTQRTNDDIIINHINSALPTIQSLKKGVDFKAKCTELQDQLESSHKSREAEIKKCIAFHAENIEKLKSSLDKADTMDNVKETKELRNVQRKMRVLQSELGVEEIVQERTRKALHERCREYF